MIHLMNTHLEPDKGRPLRFVSLFAGVGGFDLGLESCGMECVAQVEWDKHASSVLERQWPNVPRWGDISTVNGADLPYADIITFGSPCQDLSVAGKRAGLDGGRSGLFYEATRIIKEMRSATNSVYPRFAVWENVPGAFTSNKGDDFGQVLDEMADIGSLVIEWAVLDAQNFGIAQRRRRIFLLAVLDPTVARNCPDPLLPLTKGSPRDTKESRTAWQSATRSAQTGAGGSRGISNGDSEPLELGDGFLQPTVGTLTAGMSKGPRGTETTDSEHLVLVPGTQPTPFREGGYGEYVEGEFGTPRSSGGNVGSENLIVGEAIIFDGAQHGDLRITSGIVPTLAGKMGTGGNNVPMVTEPVAYSIREDAKADTFSATETDTALCLNGLIPSVQSHHAQIFIAEPQPLSYGFNWQNGGGYGNGHDGLGITEDGVGPLSISQVPAVATDGPPLAVRRLTPLECERLQGWPDNHTLTNADGKQQADSHRYKQIGNGVASPVAAWVGKQIIRAIKGTENGTADS
jgi:DNA (cytosine-5)-methyltransferase 1